MAILCPRCGREYDVTLFQFGRTIQCACGSRVGLEHRLRPVDTDQAGPRFIADAMLGRLARWLRTLGYDTAYEDDIADGELARRAVVEGRHILTRDRKLFDEWRIAGGLEIRSEKPLEQLSEMVAAFDLARPDRLFTRCRMCNAVLEPVGAEEVADLLPPRVRERQRDFSRCPGCGRIYWEGSHTKRMRAVIVRVFRRL